MNCLQVAFVNSSLSGLNEAAPTGGLCLPSQSDPGILGKTIDLDRHPYMIVGVMPRSFEFPLDAGRLSHRDLWVPMSFTSAEKNSEGENYDYGLVARMKPG